MNESLENPFCYYFLKGGLVIMPMSETKPRLAGLWLAGNEGMGKEIGFIPSLLANQRPVRNKFLHSDNHRIDSHKVNQQHQQLLVNQRLDLSNLNFGD